MKQLILVLFSLSLFSVPAFAQSTSSRMKSLGGNKKLLRRARAMSPNNKLKIVQNRLVDRNWRVEVGASYGPVAGGDPYVNTDNLGAQLDLHITPRFSLGVRYYDHSNNLTSEGERVFDQALQDQNNGVNSPRPAIDFASETIMAVINYYPIYGKLNFFDWATAQYDIYVLAGAGNITLSSGNNETYTGGLGMGIWLTKHVSTRFEVRYQSYQDQINSGSRQIDQTVFTAGIGFLL
ncbi:MAG: outer membrane beta-barrel domain-containing protein [Bdellovibrionales bacterium]|nr:outer membrane beta-barrel domain-containing protein [Bdellovibrionales bacterium]NQZ18455.1 outer membrane beta-barrel domain-containing protein [Bdellovibrionales bacterium]